MLDWSLYDINGIQVAQFVDRTAGSVEIALNGQRKAQVSISLYDEQAKLVKPLGTILHAKYLHEPIFTGVVVTPRYMGAQGQLEINAIDPSFSLIRSFLLTNQAFANIDQSEMLFTLIAFADAPLGYPSHGIERGTLQTTRTRAREYQAGQQTWAAITEATEWIDGVDIELEPVDPRFGFRCLFNTYERLGSDKTKSAIFEFNKGSHNLTDFQWEPDGNAVSNKFTQVGQAPVDGTPPQYTANNFANQQEVGIYAGYEGSSEMSEIEVVKARAMQMVAAYGRPPDYFKIQTAMENETGSFGAPGTSRFGVPPIFGVDYKVGDDIIAYAKRGALNVSIKGRVMTAKLLEADAAGGLRVELECIPSVTPAGVT